MESKQLSAECGGRTNRRGFLASAGGVAALAASGGLTVATAAAASAAEPASPTAAPQNEQSFPAAPVHRGPKSELDSFHLSTFAPLLNSQFHLKGEQCEGNVELVVAKQGPQHDESRKTEHFKLLFRAAPEAVLGQDSFQVSHPRIGTFPLFLVPVGQDEKGQYFQAIFYRIAHV